MDEWWYTYWKLINKNIMAIKNILKPIESEHLRKIASGSTSQQQQQQRQPQPETTAVVTAQR